MSEQIKRAAVRFNSWYNPTTALNTSRDKFVAAFFQPTANLSDEEADALYAFNDVAALICDFFPDQALSKGFEIKIKDEDVSTALDAGAAIKSVKETESAIKLAVKKLGVTATLGDGLAFAKVFGAAAILIGVRGRGGFSALSSPLEEDKIESIRHFNAIDRRYLMPYSWYTDPNEPNFGKPSTYLIFPYAASNASETQEVHESRLVLLDGERTSVSRRQDANGFSQSRLQKAYHALKQFGVSFDTLSSKIQDDSQGIFSMDGLIEALAMKDEDTVQARMQMLDIGRSSIRALVLDAATEKFEYVHRQWAGIHEPFDLMMQRLSVASGGIPVTILAGRSPAGENATGAADFDAMYDKIEAYQALKVEPALKRLISLVCLALDGPTGGVLPEFEVRFPELKRQSKKQAAETRQLQSAADRNYVEAGILMPEEVAVSRFTPDGWSSDTHIEYDARLPGEEMDSSMNEPEPEPKPDV